jgi:hypothetical protein
VTGIGGGAYGEVEDHSGHHGPGRSGVGICGVLAVAGAAGDPTDAAAVGHRDRHGAAAGRDQVAERRGLASFW